MNTLEIVLASMAAFFAVCAIAISLWATIAINSPRTPEEERAKWEQDLKDFDADMARRGKK
jgi:hypothetical protein